jgi:hypothetical protein
VIYEEAMMKFRVALTVAAVCIFPRLYAATSDAPTNIFAQRVFEAGNIPEGGAAAVLAIQATTTTVRITNVERGGSIILFSCSRGYREGRTFVDSAAIALRDNTGTGVIEYQPVSPIPLRSVFAAIETETGVVAFGASPGFPLSVIPFEAEKLSRDSTGEIVQLVHGMPRLVVLLVRPAKGAWIMRGFDGQEADRDRTSNGRLTLAFEDFRSIGASDKGPKALKKDDVLVAIDPSHLDIYAAEVGK